MNKLEIDSKFPNFKIHYIKNSTIWASKNYKIYKSNNLGKNWDKVGRIQTNFIYKILSQIRILSRLLRLGIQSILVLKNGTILATTRKAIFLKENNKNTFQKVHNFQYNRPLRNGITKDNKDNAYYGEYWQNSKRKKISIYKSNNHGKNWNIFYTFPKKTIRHIHAVQYDHYNNLLWVATGDKDKECKILTIDPETKEKTIIGQGSQKWRAVSFIFTKNIVYWGTDNPNNTNYIYQLKRDTKKIKKVAQSINPFYYSTKTKNYLIFATTVEKNKQDKKKYSQILTSKNGGKWKSIAKLKKDNLPPIFSYGIINFPLGDYINDKIIFTPIGIKKLDGKLIIGQIKNEQ